MFLASSAAAYAGTIEDSSLQVVLNETDGSFTVLDKRNSITWTQDALTAKSISNFVSTGASATFTMNDASESGLTDLAVTMSIDLNVVTISIAHSVAACNTFHWPFPFSSPDGYSAVMPYNEGMLLPVGASTGFLSSIGLDHGWNASMPIAGITNMSSGYMFLVETPWDASLDTRSGTNGNRQPHIQWNTSKGNFSNYTRSLKIYFYDTASGYVEMAQDVRAWADANGYSRTLTAKKASTPKVTYADSIIQFGSAPLATVTSESTYLYNQGVRNAIMYTSIDGYTDNWSLTSVVSAVIRALGFSVGWYKNYQNTYDPAEYANNTHQGYPDYLYTLSNSTPYKSGSSYYVCRLANYNATAVAQPNLLRGNVARLASDNTVDFITLDAETGSSTRECYDVTHPTLRYDDIQARKNILQYHLDNNISVGSENCVLWAVPNMVYAVGLFFIESEGAAWHTYDANYTTYITGYAYRIPLFELAFHDCIVSMDTYDNPINEFYATQPADWEKRMAWYALYGIPLNAKWTTSWDTYKAKVASSVNELASVLRKVGGIRMINHEFLNLDKSQQRTTFENGVTVTSDFVNNTYVLEPKEKTNCVIKNAVIRK